MDSSTRSRRSVLVAFAVLMSLVLPLTASAESAPAEQWSRVYGGPADDVANAVVAASDGGLVFAGSTKSNSGGATSDVWLVKTGATGEEIWSRSLGAPSVDDYAQQLVCTLDGGYLMVGYRVVNSGDLLIIKADSEGSKVWEKVYGGSNQYTTEIGYSVFANQDGTFVVGYAGDSYPRLMKVGADGIKIWDLTLGPRYYDNPVSIKQTADGGYVIAGSGYRYPNYTNKWYAWIMKTNSDGTVIWRKNFLPSGEWQFVLSDIAEIAPGGGYVAVGYRLTSTPGSYDAWILTVDSGGNVIGQQFYGGAENDWFSKVASVTDEGYTVLGTTASIGAGQSDAWLVSVDLDLNTVWSKTVGGAGMDIARGICSTSDGGMVIVGYSDSWGAGGYDGWLVSFGGSLDASAPQTTTQLFGTVGHDGWYTSDVEVSLNAIDEGCGVDATEYSLDGANWNLYVAPFVINTEGMNILYFFSTDKAGNVEEVQQQAVKIDKTLPDISAVIDAPNDNGWYNQDAVVHFEASDAVSGLASLTPEVVVVSTEGAGQFVTGTATDNAGNTSDYTVTDINIDKTLPAVTITLPANGAEYLLNDTVVVSWTADDLLSGIAKAEGTLPPGVALDAGTVGEHAFTVTASDLAANQANLTVTYYVRYAYSGILPPIRSDGKSVFKLGQTVPVKFRLQDASGECVGGAIARLYLLNSGREIEAVATSTATHGNFFRYDSREKQFVFELATRDLWAGIWQLRIALDDGTSYMTSITLR